MGPDLAVGRKVELGLPAELVSGKDDTIAQISAT
jgi:hypothetical protein